jgi:organic hydroperoxide reductase OsmC/OhrA
VTSPRPGADGASALTHHYRSTCAWEGSTGVGYEAYSRAHTVAADPADASLELSADPAFRGDPHRLNPEQLLLASASSCQLLSFLAVAARARLDVVAYEDRAEALMPEADLPVRITEIHLRPRITVRAPATAERIRHLCEVAHRECFIANSLASAMTIDPEIHIV